MSYHRHLRRNSLEYQKELKDILNPKNISKSIKSFFKHISLEHLKKIKQDNTIDKSDQITSAVANKKEKNLNFNFEKKEEKKPLNKPIRTPGENKKFKVYVKDGDKIKTVRFGDPNMEIKRDNKERRANFRARHNCDNPGPKTKPRFWSCKMWSNKNVSDLTKSKINFNDINIYNNNKQLNNKAILHDYNTHLSVYNNPNYNHFGYSINSIKKSLIEENFEPLQKGKKDILNMMGPKPEQHHHEFANWASKALPNANWQIWAARHYKNKPEDFTTEIKQKLEHFGGSQHIPDIANVRFDKQHDLHAGIKMLENAEKQYHDKIKNNTNVVKPTPETIKFVHGVEKPNRHWFNLGVGSCENEGKAMVHCGNVPTEVEGDEILSFRTEHKINNKTYHEPHLTFIYNNGFLGEMKGRGNDKPAKHYHREIANLLKDPRIKGVIGGGFKPESNFHFSDLSPELQQEVLQANPNLITSADINNDENVEKILSRIDELPEKHKNILVDIANKPNLDPKHYEKLINEDNPDIKLAIASKPDLDSKNQKKLVNEDNPDIKMALVYNPNLDPKLHEQLINEDNPDIKIALASKPNLDPKLHEKLVNDDDLDVIATIAENPNLDPKFHEKLVNDTNKWVREAIAKNPNLDPKFHEQLVNDDESLVRRAIASNPNLNPKHQKKLVNDDDLDVKLAIAKNPNLDPKFFEQLANDTDRDVKISLQYNPSYQKWKEEQSKKLAASEKYNIKYKILTKSEENQLVKILENEKNINNILKNWSNT
jgi:hypothetical protein